MGGFFKIDHLSLIQGQWFKTCFYKNYFVACFVVRFGGGITVSSITAPAAGIVKAVNLIMSFMLAFAKATRH